MSASQPSQPTALPASLLTLPEELNQTLLSHIGENDLHSLRQTCHHFQSIIPAATREQLLAGEASNKKWWKMHARRKYLSCSACLRLRPKSAFSDKMRFRVWLERTTQRLKHPFTKPDIMAKYRLCTDCGREQDNVLERNLWEGAAEEHIWSTSQI